ncbi:hypothetical protein NX059_011895 [Plenodomus lindquistii]|nr:hypothetical protein NX059_011895 [Plenodomus lindquistii]
MTPNPEKEKPTERQADKHSEDSPNSRDSDDQASQYRPSIAAYTTNKFQVDDRVWLTRPGRNILEGPYLIAGMPSPGNYTLCHENGQSFESGTTFEEKSLDFVD